MPLFHLRRLSGRVRTPRANWQLAGVLTFVAGATNAGGYLAVGQYTSHMSGIVSGIADHLALGAVMLAVAGLGALLPFVAGASCTALMVNWARRRHMRSEYALPLFLEATLLLIFGVFGRPLGQHEALALPVTVMLLCFTMGLQNAVVTKLSHSEIRTTHMTGIVTDIGIELGKALYGSREVRADRTRLRLLSMLVGLFFLGGVMGALGFRRVGFLVEIPLALLLVLLAVVPIADDLRTLRHQHS